MRRTVKVAVVAVVLVAALGGCRSMTGRTAGELVDNKLTVVKVKSKLTADRLANLAWVDVDANNGVVYLSGNARTPQQKQRATELAMQASGVRQVVNNIVVNDTAQAQAASPAASPSTAAAASGPLTGEVVRVDQGSGDVTLRMADGNNVQLRLPPPSLRTVKAGDRLTISVSPVAR
jgi:hypothetical protein